MHKVQKVFFAGPVGQLEGLLKLTEGQEPRGCIVLRFNFRGAGQSAGVHDHGKGEVGDAQAAIGYLRGCFPGLGCHVAGFSFGSWIALETAKRDSTLISVCAVAPPFKYFDSAFLNNLTIPKLFLQGKADTICPGEELQSLFPSFADPKVVDWFEGADHFFAHRLEELKKAIASRQHFLRL